MDYGLDGSTKAERWAQKKAAIVSRRDAPQSPTAEKQPIGQMTDEELQREFELKRLELDRMRYGRDTAYGLMNIGTLAGGGIPARPNVVSSAEQTLSNYVAKLAVLIRNRKKQKEFSEREQSIRSKYGE